MPPHGRVNYKCYPVWNTGTGDLAVVWNGQEYPSPWNTRREDLNPRSGGEGWMQRLWCTDSGVAGRYDADMNQHHLERNV